MDQIISAIRRAASDFKLDIGELILEHPKDESHGDWSTNVAFAMAKNIDPTSPLASLGARELAEKLITNLHSDIEISNLIERMEVAGPGFINFWLKREWLARELEAASKEGYGENDNLKGKKIIVEYTDPNPFKEMHIGHLMSNTIGEAIARLVASQGAEVVRANYQGDVGLHVAKAIWGMVNKFQISNSQITNWVAEWASKPLQERQKMMGQAYAAGASAYEDDGAAKTEIERINKAIYDKSDPLLNELYRVGREWSLEYFETIYARLGTKFDQYFFESEAGIVGLKVVDEALQKKVLEEGERGAIVYKGEDKGLHTRVFRNSLGLPTYEAKDLGLAKTKYERYPYDLSIIVTANEITEYFKVILKVMGELYPELAAKTLHKPHGVMKLTTGKMSSRTGKVVTAEGLLNELRVVVEEKMGEREIKNKEKVADQIAVGALKYTVLKQAIGGDIVYDPVKMTNLEGDTGPYLQYTYARAQSVLQKSKIQNIKLQKNPKSKIQELMFNQEEVAIIRFVYRYPEVVEAAGREYAPHLVASYLYELASRFNSFYNKHKIIGEDQETMRIILTRAVAQTLNSGLRLLGIAAPTSM